MKKYIKYMLSTALLFLMSCSEFLDVDTPKNQMDTPMVFNDERTANAAMLNVYASMRNAGFLLGNRDGIGALLGAYTDELDVVTNQSVGVKYFYDLNVQPSNTVIKNLWDISYKQIYMVNQIITGINTTDDLPEDTKKQLLGEAYGIRGILHFYLSQTFGAVPYVSTIDYEVNKNISKKSENEVLSLAIADLLEAENLLSSNYISTERIRLNQSVVQAFLARMYLYQKNWIKASGYAQMVLDDTRFQLASLDDLFIKNSTSAIWQLKPDPEGRNTLEGETYIFTAIPAPLMKLENSLITDFQTNDLRKTNWTNAIDSNNYFAYKYKERGISAGGTLEYAIVIRIEEMYLIKAEAAAQLSDFDTCNDLLNVIRLRTGLTSINVASLPEAIDAILNERRFEFFCEFGHRFYDLKRYDKLSVITEIKPNWVLFFKTLPIPLTEITLNPNLLPQNEGY